MPPCDDELSVFESSGPKGVRGNIFDISIKKKKKKKKKALSFWDWVRKAAALLYCMLAWWSLFSPSAWIRVDRVQPPAPPPTTHPPRPKVAVGSNTEGGQGKGQAWSSIGERRWHRKQSRRQMDQQMVSFRRIPEDDRAEGHTQSEREAESEWVSERGGGLWLKRFFPFLLRLLLVFHHN